MGETKRSVSIIAEIILRVGVVAVLACIVVMMIIARTDDDNAGEAPVGSFAVESFDKGWKLERKDSQIMIALPVEIDAEEDEKLVITNTLPAMINDGMNLMIRASMEDLRIYVDDEERASYSAEEIDNGSDYIPSAYVVADLNDEDAGKQIRIEIDAKVHGTINGVTIGYGNNVWFPIFDDAVSINVIAILVLVFGISLMVSLLLLGRSYKTSSMKALSLLMIDVGLWMISESRLRQLIFARPSFTYFFSFFAIEIVGVLACMYFDEIQHREHHSSYLIVECLSFLQVVANIIMHFAGVCDLYNSLKFSHIWMVLCAAVAIGNLILDIRNGNILKYRISAFGVSLFVLLSLCELVKFYYSSFAVLGSFMCVGLIALMIATIVQTIFDGTEATRLREKNQRERTFNTIESFASAMDARDEYTGGHSERVGYYARRLAKEIAPDHDLSEEDIMRIHYIGLVHDIGKIGVVDNVLNKAGLLTEEEFSLMKKHSELGYEIMTSMGSEIEGLLDGIRYHHERYDGGGYPDGLAGEDIPLIARILGIADSYDAMTSNRVYRKRLTDEEVRDEITRCAGTQFDPGLAGVFLKLIDCGEITPQTYDGVALNEKGGIRQSSLLETILQNDMKEKKNVLNPSHVRMMCYIIKLMERKGKGYQVVFTQTEKDDGAAMDSLNKTLRENIKNHDMVVVYTNNRSIVALYDRTEEERDAFIENVKKMCPEASLWPLHEPDEGEWLQ